MPRANPDKETSEKEVTLRGKYWKIVFQQKKAEK